jgi:site-specific DNA-cytosine methylase
MGVTGWRDSQLFHVDTSQTTHLSLCSGYGGIDLGLRRVVPNLRTVAYAEIEAFACENLLARMEGGQLDAAPIWSDLKTFPWAEFSGLVDVLSGGYPCQPFSAAGLRKGTDDPRHLWPFISAGIAVMRPSLCFFENVEGHISLGLPNVIEDLGRLGYRATWGIFSAAECGAPHQRKRVFIMAHRSGEGLQGCGRLEQIRLSIRREIEEGYPAKGGGFGSKVWPSRPSQPQYAWEPPRVTQPALGRNSDGLTSGLDYAKLCVSCDNRTDELRLLGNGVVPATAALAFQTLLNGLRTR